MALVTLALAWIAGLLVGIYLDIPLLTLGLFLLAVAMLIPLLLRSGQSLPIALAGLVLLLGLLRVELGPSPQATIAPSGQVALRGTIVSSPELAGASEQFVFHAEGIGYGASHGIHDEAPGWEPFDGKAVVVARPSSALVQVRERPYFRYGDGLLLRGWLEEARAFGDFDYPAYLERQGISHTLAFPEVEFLGEGKGHPLRAWLHDLRRGAASRLDAVLPQTQSALAQALLLGKRDALSQEIREDFRSSGTSHLLAVSGLHVGVVLFLTLGASAFAIGRRRQIYLLIPLATVWVYAALTGMAPPVERAAIMATVYLCAVAIGRPRSHLPAILLAAAVMAGLEPQALLEVSFQLSFAAVAGIALILPWARDQRPGEPHGGVWSAVYHHIRGGLIVSVAATLATLPLVAFNFHQVPTLGIPTTILALPAIPFLLGGSALALAADLVYAPLGQAIGWYTWIPLTYTLELVGLVARVPGSTFAVPGIPSVLVVVYYMGLVLMVASPRWLRSIGAWFRSRRTASPSRQPDASGPPAAPAYFPAVARAALVVLVASVAVLLWARVLSGGDGRLHVTFLDVGQGDSILIESPRGKRVLVDGGPAARAVLRHLDDRSGFWERDLDLIVLTHGDEDHFAGLVEVARRYTVGGVIQGGFASESPLYAGWEKVLEDKAITTLPALQGQSINLGEPLGLDVLHPPQGYGLGNRNNSGAVLRLAYGEVSFLLTADIEAEAEAELLRGYASLDSTVLKVAHHGSNTSSTRAFLRSVSPGIAVVSAGENNPFGHPSPLAMARLEETLPRERILSTAERGSIRLSTDGQTLWLHTDR